MKKSVFFIIALLLSIPVFCQDWTDAQLEKANTAADITNITQEEMQAIMYINLARLYPKDFVQIELEGDDELLSENKSYTNSLKAALNKASAMDPLYFDNALYETARCFAKESGDKGTFGHKRKNCKYDYTAECCSYGLKMGWDIALQWLIDANVPSLGHRINCLNKDYTKIAVSIHAHKKYGTCAVADMK